MEGKLTVNLEIPLEDLQTPAVQRLLQQIQQIKTGNPSRVDTDLLDEALSDFSSRGDSRKMRQNDAPEKIKTAPESTGPRKFQEELANMLLGQKPDLTNIVSTVAQTMFDAAACLNNQTSCPQTSNPTSSYQDGKINDDHFRIIVGLLKDLSKDSRVQT